MTSTEDTFGLNGNEQSNHMLKDEQILFLASWKVQTVFHSYRRNPADISARFLIDALFRRRGDILSTGNIVILYIFHFY